MTERKLTIQDWLLQKLTPAEQVEILKFANERVLDKDSEVFFMLALLRAHCTVSDNNMDILFKIEEFRKEYHKLLVKQLFEIDEMFALERKELERLMTKIAGIVASENHMIAETTGKLNILIERFDIVSKGSVQFFEAMRGLKSDFSGNSIVDLLNEEAGRAAHRNWREVSKYFERKEVVDHLLEFLKMSVQTAIILVGVAVMHHWWK